MDIHRCRFVPYPSSSINAIAFSHAHLTKKSKATPRLAIGRANGDIEIWNPLAGQWYQETVIHGGRDTSVDGLAWVVGEDERLEDGTVIPGRMRLFSIGYTMTVTEWDLENGRAKRHASGQHGEIWCIAAQPMGHVTGTNGVNGTAADTALAQRLIVGTVDGSLAMYSIDDDELHLQRVFVRTPKGNVKMVSMAFQSRNTVVVGCSDSSVKVYDVRRGQLLRKMTLGSDLAGGSKVIIVWAVKCLKNGDIVTGDSTGQVCIWDGKTYTQAQRVQSHKQDVLSLATSFDGNTIVSGGMDRRTVFYRPMASDRSRWAKVMHRRYHQHDVKALASFESPSISVIVSGGPDATPVITPLRRAGQEQHRVLSNLPQPVPVRSAPEARLIASWWEREVHVWQLGSTPPSNLDDDHDVERSRKLLGRILIKGDFNITSAAISQAGNLLVVATSVAVKAFHLEVPTLGTKNKMAIRTAQMPQNMADVGATLVQISPDDRWLCVVQHGSKVKLFPLSADSGAQEATLVIGSNANVLQRLKREVPKHQLLGGLGNYNRIVKHAAFSRDGKMLAVVDLSGYIDTWTWQSENAQVNGKSHVNDHDAATSDAASDAASDAESGDSSEDDNEEASGSGWKRNPKGGLVPRLGDTPIMVLSFSDDVPQSGGQNDYTLLAINSHSRVFTFNVLQGAMTDWSRRNRLSRLPDVLRDIRDLPKGVIWQGSRVWVYGVSFIFMLDLAQDFDKHEHHDQGAEGRRKRKRGTDTGAGNKMQIGSSGPDKMQVAVTENGNAGAWRDVEMTDRDDDAAEPESGADEQNDDDEDEDEYDDANGAELQRLRDEGQDQEQTQEESSKPPRKFWYSFKYRPILGIVPLSAAAADDSTDTFPITEVALIERPTWDMDMPPRYVAD